MRNPTISEILSIDEKRNEGIDIVPINDIRLQLEDSFDLGHMIDDEIEKIMGVEEYNSSGCDFTIVTFWIGMVNNTLEKAVKNGIMSEKDRQKAYDKVQEVFKLIHNEMFDRVRHLKRLQKHLVKVSLSINTNYRDHHPEDREF